MGQVRSVDGISFFIREGETLGLVGESGCGKTTTGRLILRALEPTAGQVFYRYQDKMVELTQVHRDKMKPYRREMQIIFQDPYSSLNPRMTVMDIVAEPLKIHGVSSGDELKARVRELLELVGMRVQHMNRYPYAFSGGQRQRIGIARALALNPKFIVCDEPVSALDVSIQAQVRQPAARSAEELRADLPVHFTRPIGGGAYQRPGRGDVPGQHRRAGPGRRALLLGRAIPIPKPCSRRCPAPTPTRR